MYKSYTMFWEEQNKLIREHEEGDKPFPFMYITANIVESKDTAKPIYKEILQEQFLTLKKNQKGQRKMAGYSSGSQNTIC